MGSSPNEALAIHITNIILSAIILKKMSSEFAFIVQADDIVFALEKKRMLITCTYNN